MKCIFNSDSIKNILTLRYDPTSNPLISKLTWSDFTETENKCNDNHLEELLCKKIEENLSKTKEKIILSLSGGIDSTLILYLLKKSIPNSKIITLTMTFSESVDESTQAANLASELDVEHRVLHIDNMLQELPKAISIIKMPFWDIHWYYLMKKAKSISKHIVSGDGGDELFGGYTFRYQKFYSELKLNMTPVEKVRLYLNCHERDWVPDQEKIFTKKIPFSWNKIYSFLLPYFDNSLSPINQILLADFNGKLMFNSTPMNARFSDYFDINLITPLLSNSLISYATHLHSKQKYDSRRNIGKIPLRNLLKKNKSKILDSYIKQGFSVNTLSLWRNHGRELCNNYLVDGRVVRDGWIDGNWIKLHFSKLDNNLDVRYVNKFLGLLAFEIWYRLFITKEISSTTLI